MHIISAAVKQLVLLGKREEISIFKNYVTVNKWFRRKMPGENLPSRRSNPIIKTLDSPEFKSIHTPELKVLSDIFKKYNYEIRIAGGAVRDILMGITPKDLDFATTATPTQMKDMFETENIRLINSNGEKHGTITSRINEKENFEVTTLRIDVVTDGRHAEVEFTTDWLLDAGRRDLTINSMFLGLDGKVYDYFYGYDDLLKRRVAFVGEPAARIQEDFLRIMRYFRFYGRIAEVSDNHDKKTIQAIKDNAEGLERISGERIWMEWNKILLGNFSRELTKMLIECGCSKYMGLPDNPDIKNFDEIYSKAESNNVKLQPISRVAALLNDEEEFVTLFKRLKFSNVEKNVALFIIQNRNDDLSGDRPLKLYQGYVLKTTGSVTEMKDIVCEFLRYKGAMSHLNEFENWNSSFPVTGSMVRPYMQGNNKIIGSIMLKLKDIWIDSDFKMSTEELLSRVPELIDEAAAKFAEMQKKREQQREETKNRQKELKRSRLT